MTDPKNCVRIDANRLKIDGTSIDNTIYANRDVLIEQEAITELKELLTVDQTAQKMFDARPDLFKNQPGVDRVVLSPDFHKGAGIPIGTTLLTKEMVIPQSIGSDINCGVKLLSFDLNKSDVKGRLDSLETILRGIFFEGRRNIPLSKTQRFEIITNGVKGLNKETEEGIWNFFEETQHSRDLANTKHGGGFDTNGKSFGLGDYLGRDGISRDSQIGSIGGGNHFVELQYVDKIIDRVTAYNYGIQKGQLLLMVHAGSVNIGHHCGDQYSEVVKRVYRQTGLKFPANKIFPLPNNTPEYDQFWVMLHNAVNFAFANRLFLGLMFKQALSKCLGRSPRMKQIYDTPHNLAWQLEEGKVLHRKGSSPAEYGEPVLIPGSMGASSYLMSGLGNTDALNSASHGAGRALSRGKALKIDEGKFEEFLKEFRIVTPIDPNRRDIKSRKDILKQWHDALKKEAPFAYKDIYPVVNTLKDGGVAEPVAELKPLLTIKGS